MKCIFIFMHLFMNVCYLMDWHQSTNTHDRYFFLHTFWLTTFDFQRRLYYKERLFPLKSFYASFKMSTLPATAVRFFTLTSNLHKVTSFFDETAVKTNITWWRRYLTTYALNTRDFLSGPGWDNMGILTIVGPGKTRGYPYPVCKKRIVGSG